MHTYSTDNDNRPTVYGILGFTAYAAALVVGWLSTTLSVVIPAVAGITISWGVGFTLLTATFRLFIWKTGIAPRNRRVKRS
jgi:hypothetical protein